MRIFVLVGLMATLMAATGCGRKNESGVGGAAEGAGTPKATPSAANAAATENAGEVDVAAKLDRLTQAVRKYSAERQRVPRSLEELVAAGYLTEIPNAPGGKRFVIQPQRVAVVLENR